jgi:hypothetical protein
MSEVIFIFSPFLPASASSPYLAPHLLSTILRKDGIKVTNLDFNREMVDRLDRPEFLNEFALEVQAQLKNIDQLDPIVHTSLEATAEMLEGFQKNHRTGIKISFQNKVNFGNYITNVFLNNLKSVKDYSERGFEVTGAL